MASEKFRRQLRQEGQTWQQEGLISPEQWQTLNDRYQLDRLEQQASHRFTFILISLGCILVGLGVITYVAANWQDIPRLLRVALLFGAFVGVNAGGFSLWRLDDRTRSRVGQGGLLLGGLMLGANMALMAQMFHIGGPLHPLFLAWGLGVLIMAYSLRITLLGVLAAILIGSGYWSGWWEIFWAWNRSVPETSFYSLMILNMPLVAGILFIPLAYLCRSRVLFTLGAIGVGMALTRNWHEYVLYGGQGFAAITLILPGALLWGYDDTLWADLTRRRSSEWINSRPFQWIARSLSVVWLGVTLYWFSFRYNTLNFDLAQLPPSAWLYSLPALGILFALMVVEWVYLVRSEVRTHNNTHNNIHNSTRNSTRNSTIVMGGMVLGLAGLSLMAPPQPDAMMTFLINSLLAVLAIGTIRESIDNGRRAAFWFGMVLLVLQILSRLFEYETDLLFKALMFVVCGGLVIFAGLWFERHMRQIRTTHLSLPDATNPPSQV